MIDDGTFDRHLADAANRTPPAARRRDVGALERHGAKGKLQWAVPDGGLYLWCRLGGRVKTSSVHAHALAESLAFVPARRSTPITAATASCGSATRACTPARADDIAKRMMRAVNAAKRDLAAPSQLVAIV